MRCLVKTQSNRILGTGASLLGIGFVRKAQVIYYISIAPDHTEVGQAFTLRDTWELRVAKATAGPVPRGTHSEMHPHGGASGGRSPSLEIILLPSPSCFFLGKGTNLCF